MTKKIILLQRQPKNHSITYCLALFSIVIPLIISFFIKTYTTFSTSGIIKCSESCEISLSIPYKEIDLFSQDPKLMYLEKEYKIKNIIYEEPYLNNNIAYEDVRIETDLKSDDRLINIQLLYNKQRIIKKIKNIILERE